MPAMNVLTNLFVPIYNTEARRKGECVVLPTSKIGTNVLETLKKMDTSKIMKEQRIIEAENTKSLIAKITKCGAISPRFKVKKTNIEWKNNSCFFNRGMLILQQIKG